jgi:hypothetical protein
MTEKLGFEVGLVHLPKFLRHVGVSRSTGWRWVKAGLLRTVNIYGRNYVTSEAIDDFKARAESGEFSKLPVTPCRTPKDIGEADGTLRPGAERRAERAVSLI